MHMWVPHATCSKRTQPRIGIIDSRAGRRTDPATVIRRYWSSIMTHNHQIKGPECTSNSTYQYQVYKEKNPPGQYVYVCTIYATFPCIIIDIEQKNENENVKYVTAALELSFGTSLADGLMDVAK